MKDFPEFMKNKSNHISRHISSKEQNIEDIDCYFYEGADGSQMAFWTCYSDRVSNILRLGIGFNLYPGFDS